MLKLNLLFFPAVLPPAAFDLTIRFLAAVFDVALSEAFNRSRSAAKNSSARRRSDDVRPVDRTVGVGTLVRSTRIIAGPDDKTEHCAKRRRPSRARSAAPDSRLPSSSDPR